MNYCIFAKAPTMKRFVRMAHDEEGWYMTKNVMYASLFRERETAEELAAIMRGELTDWQFEVRPAA